MKKNLNGIMAYALILMMFAIYGEFITLEKFYVYTFDIASDAYFQFWPTLNHLHDYLRSDGFPGWSFNDGLGNIIFPGWVTDPFMLAALSFPKDVFPYTLVYVQMAKIAVAFLFFYAYLRLLKLSSYASFFGALLFAFNGHIIFRGGWYAYATEAVTLSCLLFAFEVFYQKRKWWALSLGLFSITFTGIFFFYIYSILIAVYALVRWQFDEEGRPSFLLLAKQFVLGYVVGVGLSLWQILPGLINMLDSPRVTGEDSNFLDMLFSGIFSLNSAEIYYTSFLRLFSTDIMGRAASYRGWANALEGPLFYCGLLSLLLVMQTITTANRYRRECMVFLGLALLYILSPYFRFLLNGFSGVYYKISSLWVIAVLVVNAAIAFDLLIKGKKLNLLWLVVTATGLLLPLIWFYRQAPEEFDQRIFLFVVVAFLTYTAILITNHFIRKPRLAGLLLLAITAVELVISSYISVGHREAMTPQMLVEKKRYNDFSQDAVSWLRETDKSFYRIDKSFDSVFFNDSLIQNYHGTRAYNSQNSAGYIRFIRAMDVPLYNSNPSYFGGFEGRPLINTLLGVKYYLMKEGQTPPRGYTPLKTFGDVVVYENTHFLPLGFVYTGCMKQSEFSAQQAGNKDKILLVACVLPDEVVAGQKVNMIPAEAMNDALQSDVKTEIVTLNLSSLSLLNASFSSGSFPQDVLLKAENQDPGLIVELSKAEQGRFVAKFTLESNGRAMGQIFHRNASPAYSEEASARFTIEPGQHAYSVPFDGSVRFIRFDFANVPGDYRLNDFQIYKIVSDTYYDSIYARNVEQLNKSGFILEKYSHNELSGRFTTAMPGVLFFSIPYNKGWRLLADNKPVPLFEINNGMLGAFVEAGTHEVHLTFEMPLLKLSSYVSLGFLLLLVGALAYGGSKRRQALVK